MARGSEKRRITVELTRAQYVALRSAVARSTADLEVQGGRDAAYELATVDRAWEKIRRAWWRL